MRLSADKPPCEDDTESEMEYPLTPPLSDTSESRPLSPDYDDRLGMITMQVSELQAPKSRKPGRQRNVLKRRKREFTQYLAFFRKSHCHVAKSKTIPAVPLTLNLVSRQLSKPAIASVARSYVRTLRRTARKTNVDPEFELSSDELGSILEGMLKDLIGAHDA
jgi:dehydrodolichyl diphosphate syntase complex subunit NUS1